MDHELGTESWVSVLEQVIQLHPQKIVFTGGEPLLRKDIFYLASKCHDMVTKDMPLLCLISNGTFIDSINSLELTKVFDEVRISIDGPPEINDALRGKGSFKKAINAFAQLQQLGAKIGVSITVTSPLLEQLAEFLEALIWKYHVLDLHLSTFKPVGRESEQPDLLCPKSVVNKALSAFWEKHFGISSTINRIENKNIRQCRQCGVGAYLNVLPNGDVYPCHVLCHSDFLLGNLMKHSLEAIFRESPLLEWLRNLTMEQIVSIAGPLVIVEEPECIGELCSYCPDNARKALIRAFHEQTALSN